MSYSPRNPNGQNTMANSEPVVLASDHSDLKVTLDGEAISLPTGAATSANQTTIIGHLDGVEGLLTTIDADTSNISTKIDTVAGAVSGTEMQVDVVTLPSVTIGSLPNEGQQTMANSISVAIASDQSAIPVSGTVSVNEPVSIDDNGGSLTVDGSVSITGTPTVEIGATSLAALESITVQNGAGASAVNIQDGGNSITVDGTVTANLAAGTNNIGDVDVASIAAGTNYIGKVRLTDGTTDTDIRDLANSNALNVAIVDGTGNQITSFGGGTQYTEGDTDASITGTALLMEGAADTLVPAQGTVADGLLVNLGTNNDVTVTGTVTANLAAGTNNIGDVDVLSVPAPLSTTGGGTEATALRVTLANDSTGVVSVDDNGGALTVDAVNLDIRDLAFATDKVDISGSTITAQIEGIETPSFPVHVSGNVAHDGVDSGNPVKVGAKAIAHGTNPTAVAAGDRTDLYANRAGIPFYIGGHPNIIRRTVKISDADNAQTDASMVGTINAGTKIVLTQLSVMVDSATTNTGGVLVKIGFGATTIPADSSTGANGIVACHNGIAAGSGFTIGDGSGIIAIGGDGEELRLTCEDPTSGNICISFSYYTIES